MSLGMLGAMAGAGTGISQAGQTMATVALNELKARRLAEYQRAETDYKIAATEASEKRMAPHALEQKEAELQLAKKYGEPKTHTLSEGGMLVDSSGNVLASNANTTQDQKWAHRKVTEKKADIALQVQNGMLTPEEGQRQIDVLDLTFGTGQSGTAAQAGSTGASATPSAAPETRIQDGRTYAKVDGQVVDITDDQPGDTTFQSAFQPPPRPGQAQAPATAPAMAPATAPAQAPAPAQPQARGLMGDNPFIDPAHMARLDQARARDDERVAGITETVKGLPGKAVEVAKDAKSAVTAGAAAQRVRAALQGGFKPSARDIKLAEGKLTEQEKQQLRELKIR